MREVLVVRDAYRAQKWAMLIQECSASGFKKVLSTPTIDIEPIVTGRVRERTYWYRVGSVIVCVTDAKKPRLLARLFVLCWHYLSSRQVTLQVLSAQMSLTAVFGMGTGGPSSQSIPTMSDEALPHPLLCQSPRSALTSSPLLTHCKKLVTRTGFEPMLKA